MERDTSTAPHGDRSGRLVVIVAALAAAALTALHATFEAGRLVDACSSSDECDGRPCVDRRCQAAAPSP